MEVKIACKPTADVTLEELNDFQSNLKVLTDDNYAKLRNSMTEYGFSFPFFIWIDSEGKKWTADGKQRTRVLSRMQEEGIQLPERYPAFEVIASDRREAKKKVLLCSSRYGKIDEGGMTDYLNEPGFEIDAATLEEFVDFPELDFGEPPVEEEKVHVKKEEGAIRCPECNAEFLPSEAKLAE